MRALNSRFSSIATVALTTVLSAGLLAGSAHAQDKTPASSKAAKAPKLGPTAVMKTSAGVIEIELDRKHAPNSVRNFIHYAKTGRYNGTIFHRVIKNFMIQGGGFDTNMEKRPVDPPIKNEANNGLSNQRGTVSMARTGDPHSATNQFFINTVDNKRLDFTGKNPRGWGYAVFGRVTKGLDVVERIRSVKTGACGHFRTDCPQTQVVILNVAIKE